MGSNKHAVPLFCARGCGTIVGTTLRASRKVCVTCAYLSSTPAEVRSNYESIMHMCTTGWRGKRTERRMTRKR